MMMISPNGAIAKPVSSAERRETASGVSATAFEFPEQGKCHSVLETMDFGCVNLMNFEGSGLQKAERTRSQISSDGADYFFMFMPIASRFAVRYRGMVREAPPESFVLLPTAIPFEARICERQGQSGFAAICAQAPAPLLRRRFPRFGELCGEFHDVAPGMTHFMRSVFEAALDDGPRLGAEGRDSLGSVLLDVMANATASLGASSLSDAVSSRERLMQKAREFIHANLSCADLSPAKVADYCGVSTRYLQSVFSEQAIPIARFIKEQRLQRCHEALHDPSLARRSIISIAEEWGFDDSAHFSRIYRTRFGIAPSRTRAKIAAVNMESRAA